MNSKTFPFFVINKNDMTLKHFAKTSNIASYLCGRKLKGILIIMNEKQIFPADSFGTGNVFEIQKILDSYLNLI